MFLLIFTKHFALVTRLDTTLVATQVNVCKSRRPVFSVYILDIAREDKKN